MLITHCFHICIFLGLALATALCNQRMAQGEKEKKTERVGQIFHSGTRGSVWCHYFHKSTLACSAERCWPGLCIGSKLMAVD